MKKMKIVIMGATSGIGLEVARLFHKEGHSVAIAGRRLDNLRKISAELGSCPYAQIDVIQTDAPMQLQELTQRLGGMDIYLHVSGIGKQNRNLDTDIELATVETNVVGFTRLINHAYLYFAERGHGHIAAVTSIAGTKGLGVAPSYSATKRYCNTYLEALTQLAYMKGQNITFTDIRPGFVDTDLLADKLHYPMLMKPESVADAIVKGILKKKHIITIDWRYRILVFFWQLVPTALWVRIKFIRN